MRERPALLLISALLLFGPWVLAAVWAVRDPGAASGVVPSEYRSVTEPRERGTDLGLTTDRQAAFSSEIFTNNIRVTIVAFAGGIAAGIGTAALLVYQGVLFGAITGLAIWAGNGASFFELVTAHGVLELSCIVVASAAGLRMGWALVSPGHRRRGVALAAEARVADERTFGVGELAGLLGRLLSQAFPGPLWVQGQIRNLSRSTNGHVYLDLAEPPSGTRHAATTAPVPSP